MYTTAFIVQKLLIANVSPMIRKKKKKKRAIEESLPAIRATSKRAINGDNGNTNSKPIREKLINGSIVF